MARRIWLTTPVPGSQSDPPDRDRTCRRSSSSRRYDSRFASTSAGLPGTTRLVLTIAGPTIRRASPSSEGASGIREAASISASACRTYRSSMPDLRSDLDDFARPELPADRRGAAELEIRCPPDHAFELLLRDRLGKRRPAFRETGPAGTVATVVSRRHRAPSSPLPLRPPLPTHPPPPPRGATAALLPSLRARVRRPEPGPRPLRPPPSRIP